MSEIPNVNITVAAGVRAVAPKARRIPLLIGCSSSGTVNTPQKFRRGQVAALIAAFGYGPLVQAAAIHLNEGNDVVVCRATGTTAGDEGTYPAGTDNATTVTHPASETGTCTLTGASYDHGDFKILFTAAGAIATTGIKFKVSKDGGLTYDPEVSLGTATSYAIPNTNITLVFTSAETWGIGSTIVYRAIEPKWASADVTSALVAARSSQLDWDFVQVVGKMSATEAAVLKTDLTSAETAYRFLRSIAETVRQLSNESYATWYTALGTDFAALTSAPRIAVFGGTARVVSPVDGMTYQRPAAWLAAVEFAKRKPHVSIARVSDGPLNCTIHDSNLNLIAYDEKVYGALTPIRIGSLRTFENNGLGVYITQALTMAVKGTKYELLQYGAVMDVACATAYVTLLQLLNREVRVNPDGTILADEARTIEREIEYAEKIAVVDEGMAQAVTASIDESINVRDTGIVNVTIEVDGLAYIITVNATMGYKSAA